MNKLSKTLIVLAVIALLAVACSSQVVQAKDSNQEEKLLGSWQVKVTTPTQGTFPALLTFTTDGSLIADEPGSSPFETSGHGNWIGKSSEEIAYTFVALIGSTNGSLSATIKVVGTLKFDSGKDSWSGPFKIDVTDPSGQVMVSDRGIFNLTRIAVEAIQ
jgi:hypothetical protein